MCASAGLGLGPMKKVMVMVVRHRPCRHLRIQNHLCPSRALPYHSKPLRHLSHFQGPSRLSQHKHPDTCPTSRARQPCPCRSNTCPISRARHACPCPPDTCPISRASHACSNPGGCHACPHPRCTCPSPRSCHPSPGSWHTRARYPSPPPRQPGSTYAHSNFLGRSAAATAVRKTWFQSRYVHWLHLWRHLPAGQAAECSTHHYQVCLAPATYIHHRPKLSL